MCVAMCFRWRPPLLARGPTVVRRSAGHQARLTEQSLAEGGIHPQEGKTALNTAAENSHIEVYQLLLRCKQSDSGIPFASTPLGLEVRRRLRTLPPIPSPSPCRLTPMWGEVRCC